MSKYIGLFLVLVVIALLWAARGEAAEDHGCRMAAYRDAQGLTRMVWGCAWPDEARTTEAASLYPAMLTRLSALARIAADRQALSPMSLPNDQAWEPGVTICDRWQLWAEDEGPRAPEMTRQRKIAQACK
jgi:hypothetical protein